MITSRIHGCCNASDAVSRFDGSRTINRPIKSFAINETPRQHGFSNDTSACMICWDSCAWPKGNSPASNTNINTPTDHMSYIKQGRFAYHCTAVTPFVSSSQCLDFGSEILGGPTNCVKTVSGVFGESEIGDFNCRVFVFEDH